MGSQGEIQQLKALLIDRSQQMIHMGDQMEAKDRQIAESASLIHDLNDRLNTLTQRLQEQSNVIMSIQNEQNRQVTFQPAQGQSSCSRSGPCNNPSPTMPSIPESFVKPAPMNQSIATPKSSHPGTELKSFAVDCTPTRALPASGFPSGCGEMHLAPPRSTGLQVEHSPVRRNQEIGMQIQGDQNLALSMQVQQLTQQLHLMMNMMNQNAQGTGHPNVPNPNGNRIPGENTPPGSSSSSSSSNGQKPRKGGGSPGGGGSPPQSPSPSSKQGAASSPGSSVSSDPYKREKKTMRIKQYDQMKLPPLPADAAKCRSFRNSVFSIVCKFAKNDEGEVFKWINLCNESETGKELEVSGNFPILDRILGAKLLEAAKSTKFALEYQTMQEKFHAIHRQPKGRLLLWHVFQKFKLDKDRGTALSQHHLLSLKMQGNDVKALEDFKQRYDYCMGALESSEIPPESSLRSLLFENLKGHPKMMLVIDRFRESSAGSSKRTSKWLYQKLTETIEISQMDVNTVSVDKALTAGGQDAKIAGAQGDPKRDKPKKEEKPDKKEKPKRNPKMKNLKRRTTQSLQRKLKRNLKSMQPPLKRVKAKVKDLKVNLVISPR